MAKSDRILTLAENASDTIREFLALFEQDDASVVVRGLEELAPQMGILGTEAMPIFLAGLKHPMARSRVFCAWALCGLEKLKPGSLTPGQNREVDDVFVRVLSTETRDVQLFAVGFLAMSGLAPGAAEPQLRRLLADADLRFRVCAAAILANFVSDPGNEASLSTASILAVLMNALKEDDAFSRMIAATALSQRGIGGPESVNVLARMAEKGEPPLKLGIVQLLGQVRFVTKAAIRVLSEIRDDETISSEIRAAATRSLIGCAEKEAEFLPVFRQAIEDGDFPVFQGCVEASIRTDHVYDEIGLVCAATLDTETVELRRQIAYWLSQSRKLALCASSQLIDRLWVESDSIVLEFVLKALGLCGSSVVAPLIAAIREGDMRKVPYAQSALIEMGGSCVAAVIRELLRDERERVRIVGLGILIGIGPRAALASEAIMGLLKDADAADRPLILRAVAMIATKDDDAIQALADAYVSSDVEVSHWATLGLIRIGRDAVPFIERMKAGGDAHTVTRLDELLYRLGSGRAEPPSRLDRYGKDSSLLLFAYIGHLVEANGPLSFRRLEKIFAGEDGKINRAEYDGVPSASEIRLTIEELEDALCDGRRIIDRKAGSRKSGSLTPEGKRLFREVRVHLRNKKLWMADDA
jgi:HEAT repeat protein